MSLDWKVVPIDAVEVIRDARLTPDAARIILDVAVRGEGEHEVTHTHFGILLNHQGGDRRVRRALHLATELGWISRRPGGRGHSDRYAFRPPPHEAPYPDRLPANVLPKSYSPTQFGQANAPVVEEERRETKNPPVVPPGEPSEEARTAVAEHAAKLNGCKSALLDYVAVRIPHPGRQRAYVYAVVGWLDGAAPWIWKRPDGSSVPPGQRTKLLSGALNELAASDETKMKRPPGDTANLSTKLDILIQQGARRGRRSEGTNGRGAPGASRGEAAGSEAGLGGNHGEHVVEE